jgi:hypothetical protein
LCNWARRPPSPDSRDREILRGRRFASNDGPEISPRRDAESELVASITIVRRPIVKALAYQGPGKKALDDRSISLEDGSGPGWRGGRMSRHTKSSAPPVTRSARPLSASSSPTRSWHPCPTATSSSRCRGASGRSSVAGSASPASPAWPMRLSRISSRPRREPAVVPDNWNS